MKRSIFVIAAAIVIILAAGNSAHATRQHCTQNQSFDEAKHQCIDKEQPQPEPQPEPTPEPVPAPHIQPTPPASTPVEPEPVLETWGK